MVGTNTFANAFPSGGIRGMVNKTVQPANVNQQPVAQQPQPVAPQPIQYDPETEKLRKLMLKVLTILVGGLAAALIIWRVIGKFI